MKWKDTDKEIQSISGSLKGIILNPDVVLESLLLERGQNIRLGAYQKYEPWTPYSKPLVYYVL